MPVADFSPSRDRCAIVGIGKTDYSRNSGRTELTLATQACQMALRDAGLMPSDVDGIVRCDMEVTSHMALASSLGANDITFWADAGPGGAAPAAMVGQAVAAIVAGLATTVIAFRSINGRSGRRYASGAAGRGAGVMGGGVTYDELYVPYGLQTAGQVFALSARRHMIDYGTRQEALGEVAMNSRSNANNTPHAMMRDRQLTMEEYLNSRMISDPLRVNDYCLESDGACAVVITSLDRAKDLRQPPVLIRSVSAAYPTDVRPGMLYSSAVRDDICELPGRRVAQALWSRGGLGPGDVDVAQIYDCFSIAVLMQIEDFGFCKTGEGGPFIESGALRPGGAIPINTAGGNMSEAYIHGMNHVYEGVRQIRGEADVQVPDAEVCLVTGGPLPVSSAVVLRRA